MSNMVKINFNPDRNTLHKFGYIAFIGFGLLALMASTSSFLFSFGLGSAKQPVTIIFISLAAYCLVAGLLLPAANRPVFVGLSILTYPIGFVLSYVIMGVLFFGLFAIIATLMRIFRYDPMSRKLDDNVESYWSDARPARPRTDYFRQY